MKERKDFLLNIAYYGVIFAIVWVVFKFVLPAALPFLLGYCVAILICRVTRKCKRKIKLVRILSTILFYLIVGGLFSLGFLEIFSSLYSGVKSVPTLYEEEILPITKIVYNSVTLFISELDPELTSVVEVIAGALSNSLKNLVSMISQYIVSLVSSIVSFVPSLFISTVITIIATFFFVIDYDRISDFFNHKVPLKWRESLGGIKYYISNTLLVVIRSYAIIMLLTFSELSVMFLICGIEYPFLIATIIAIFDIMPILGTGGIMIPWAVISFVMGNYVMGIELIVMYVIVTVVRNFVEPKVVGAQLGLHPIVTLISMFIGLRLFGFIGLFGLPIGISYYWKKRMDKE